MRPSKVKRNKNAASPQSQKKFLSIVLVFFSLTFCYFSYKRVASENNPAPLKLASQAIEKMAVNEGKLTLVEQDVKPLPFASIEGTDVVLYFPAHVSEIVGVGFHESDKKGAFTLKPVGRCYARESTQTVSRSISLSRFPVLFVMYSRGRRQSPTSAVDVAVKPDTIIRSPVNGVVTKVEIYYLYGRYVDCRVEIQPDDHPELRVAMIHLDSVGAKEGQRVSRGKTEIGKVRKLSHRFDSQINEYVPEDCDHTHVQVNKYVPEEETKE